MKEEKKPSAKTLKIGNKIFDTSRTHVMGIINITPDSFSDGGKFFSFSDALNQAEKMVGDGAGIIDIGGQSTRPGYAEITAEEEAARILPVVAAVKKSFDIPVSVDTYFSAVAEAALAAGADMINDIWGLKRDKKMAEVIAKNGAACCLMHNDTAEADYTADPCALITKIKNDLIDSVSLAKSAGIADNKIILDIGIGFAKTYEGNLTVLANLKEFAALGYPLLLGASRKSVVGLATGLPASERLEGTLATTAVAVLAGCAFVRVHDVKENVRVIKMIEEIKKWMQ